MNEVTVTLIEPGSVVEVKSKFGAVRKDRVGRVFEVRLDGEPIGYVAREMLTRERRAQGLRYVLGRWQSPGWVTKETLFDSRFECSSKSAGVERLVWNAKRVPETD